MAIAETQGPMPRFPVVARCALQDSTPSLTPWPSDDQLEVVLLLLLSEVVELIGPSTTEVVLDESDELLLLLSEVVESIGPSTIEVVLDESVEVLLVLPSVLVLDEVVPGSDEDEGEGVLEVLAEPETVTSMGDAWRTAPVPPARAQTEMASPTAARDEIAATSRDGVGMERSLLGGWQQIRRSPQNEQSQQTLQPLAASHTSLYISSLRPLSGGGRLRRR